MKTATIGAIAAGFVLTLAGASAQAACLPFSNFGPEFTSLGNTLTCTDGGGNTVTITGPGSGFTLYTQGSGWNGQFATGTALLFDNSVPGAVTVDWSSPIHETRNIGLQANYYGPFTATLTAYLGEALVGSESYSSTSSGIAGSLPSFSFSSVGGYDRIVLTTTDDGAGFAIGPVSGGVPEPAAWAVMLVGLGLAGASLRASRRSRATVA